MMGSGHLGPRVSALLDGRLSVAEEERAWAHVACCGLCQDLVESEGWVKTQLAGLGWGGTPAPEQLKGALVGPDWSCSMLPPALASQSRVRSGLGLLGGGVLGAAALGVVLLAAPAAQAPVLERRAPTSGLMAPVAPVQANVSQVQRRQPAPTRVAERIKHAVR